MKKRRFFIGINKGRHFDICEKKYMGIVDNIGELSVETMPFASSRTKDGKIIYLFDIMHKQGAFEALKDKAVFAEKGIFEVGYAPDYNTVEEFEGSLYEALEYVATHGL